MDSAPRSPLIAPHSPIVPSQMHTLDQAYGGGRTGGVGNLQQGNAVAGVGGGQMVGDLIPANDKYQIMVDVSHFNPEEISVKMVDNAVIVTGKHEDKADNYGYVSRQFSRKYLLPADVEPESVTSTLSADGILSIQAPRKPLQITDDTAGRSVPIAISNQSLSPALNLVPPQFPSAAVQQPSATTTTMPMSNVGSSGTSSTITVEQQTSTAKMANQGQGSLNVDNIGGMNIPVVHQQQQQPAPPTQQQQSSAQAPPPPPPPPSSTQ